MLHLNYRLLLFSVVLRLKIKECSHYLMPLLIIFLAPQISKLLKELILLLKKRNFVMPMKMNLWQHWRLKLPPTRLWAVWHICVFIQEKLKLVLRYWIPAPVKKNGFRGCTKCTRTSKTRKMSSEPVISVQGLDSRISGLVILCVMRTIRSSWSPSTSRIR